MRRRSYAGAYPCEERDGYAWVYRAGSRVLGRVAAGMRTLPRGAGGAEVFGEVSQRRICRADLPCNVDHGIIGLMDPAHGPFVHQSWWWRSRASIHAKEKQFEPMRDAEHDGRNAGFRMASHAPSSNSLPYKLLGAHGPVTTTIDFVLPNRRYETIRSGEKWFAS